MNDITIEQRQSMGLSELGDLYDAYVDTFRPLAALAAQRHVMTEREFVDVMLNPWITKWVAQDRNSRHLAGLAVATDSLSEWPLISPEYFEAQYPEEAKRQAIWYIGFVMVTAPFRRTTAYRLLLEAASKPQRDAKGIAAMDFCAYNEDALRLPQLSGHIVRAFAPHVRTHRIDTQAWWVFDFREDH